MGKKNDSSKINKEHSMKSFLSILILTSLCASAEDGTPNVDLTLKSKTAPESINSTLKGATTTSKSTSVRMMKGKFANANCKIINGKWVCDETVDAKKLVNK